MNAEWSKTLPSLSLSMNLSKFLEMVKDREAWHAAVPGSPWDHKKLDMTEWLNNNNEHFVVVHIFLTNSQ